MRKGIIKNGKAALFILFCMMLAGCAGSPEAGTESSGTEEAVWSAGQSGSSEKPEEPADSNEAEENTGEDAGPVKEEEHHLTPVRAQWQDGDMDYDIEDTIYYKTYYDDFVRGKQSHIEYPDINLRDGLEDYFLYGDEFEMWDNLVEMFFDYRTIEMPEEELQSLFCRHGYVLSFRSAEAWNVHVRFVQITEEEGLSVYPTRIMIQTWDREHIYLQDITSPIQRKIMSAFILDGEEPYQMVVHSSGLSRDYDGEEELSFWEFHGTYWVLVPVELETDTSHAHIFGEAEEFDDLFEASYYRDGITYRPSRQSHAINTFTLRLGKMEQIGASRRFRLFAVYETETGSKVWPGSTYIEFTIK